MMHFIIIFLLTGGILFPAKSLYAAQQATVDKIKAAYVYQLTQFVTWPELFTAAGKSFSICVLGDEPIGNELKPLNHHSKKGHIVRVSFPKNLRNTSDCNMLYIATTEQYRLQAILDYVKNKPVLTVSSVPDFARKGGMIGFVILDNKVRLEINNKAVRQAQLNISAKLLEVSMLVAEQARERSAK